MGHASRRVAPKRSTTAVRSRPGSKKTVSKRRRTPLSVKFVKLLDRFRRRKPTSLRAFCNQNDIPYEAAHYHLKHSSSASRNDRNAEIVQIVLKMSKKTRVKHQSTRISAADVIKKLGRKAGGLSVRQVNRILKQALPERPKRQRITGQPNAESTPSQMRTIAAHQRYIS